MACKWYITASLLNSWQYNLNNGTLEEFIKVLNKEEFEPNEYILKGFAFEKYMQENFKETLNGAYQVKLTKECGDIKIQGVPLAAISLQLDAPARLTITSAAAMTVGML